MSIRTRIRRRTGRGPLARATVVGLAVVASSALGIASASAAASATISLDPTDVHVMLYPVENMGPLTARDSMGSGSGGAGGAFGGTDTPAPVTTEWGGAVVVQLPAGLDGSAMRVSLDLMATMDSAPTRTYSTTTTAPNHLVLTDLGSGSYRVDLPADDSVDGPLGGLTFENITSTNTHVDVGAALPYLLTFTGTGTAVRNLAPQIMAMAELPCPAAPATPCAPTPVDAGGTFDITVPPASLLRALGLGTLDDMALALGRFDDNGDPIGEPLVLTDHPGLVTVSDAYHATVHLPATMHGGTYELTLVQATGTAGAISVTFGELQVKGIPATPRIVNTGLLSNTEWSEPAVATAPRTGKGSAPLVGAGAGMLLLAGGAAVGTLRGRRQSAVAE
jgi:hypothetical protein